MDRYVSIDFQQSESGECVSALDDRVEMDANAVENRIQKIVLTRKNTLFVGGDEDDPAPGVIASLLATASLSGINQAAYLRHTLEAIAAGHPRVCTQSIY